MRPAPMPARSPSCVRRARRACSSSSCGNCRSSRCTRRCRATARPCSTPTCARTSRKASAPSWKSAHRASPGADTMDLRDSDEDRQFRNEVRAFVAARLPDDIRRKVLGFLRVEREDYVRWQRILFERGWGAPGWPVEWGGCGWNAVQRNIFDEECFSAGAPRQMPFGLSMIAPVLMKYGTPEQQARFLPRIVSMEDWWCQGYSEPGAGSDLASLKTRAERVGSNYVVTGQKIWTSFAQWANCMFALVRTDSSGKPQRGISLLLIPMDAKGIGVRPIKTLDGGHDINEVFLDAVEVPVENLVGVENDGWTIAKYLLGHERTTIAGLGMCKRLLRRLKEVARTQTRSGR